MKSFPSWNGEIGVKICGLASEIDIVSCGELGVSAVGFLLSYNQEPYPTDKLILSRATKLIRSVPANVASVLLIKSTDIEEIVGVVADASPDVIQLQGNFLPGDVALLKRKIPNVKLIKTIKIEASATLDEVIKKVRSYSELTDAILLDSAKGGSGQTHDWNISKNVSNYMRSVGVPFILAGGLNVSNIKDAIDFVRPACVDIMTGASLEKGVKDISKVRRIMEIVRSIS